VSDDPGRGPYAEGLIHLGRYLQGLDDAELAHAIERFRSAVEGEPDRVAAWVALGFALDAADARADALQAVEHAARLDPDDAEVEVLVVTLLSEAGPEEVALAAVEATALRLGIDVEELRRNLKAVQMPTDARTLVANAFVHARNFIRARLEDEIERVLTESDPEGARRREETDRRRCLDERERLRGAVDAERAPDSVRDAVPWAARLGAGDAECRDRLAQELDPDERAELAAVVARTAPFIHAWLDSFGADALTEEAAALLHLLLAVEEGATDS